MSSTFAKMHQQDSRPILVKKRLARGCLKTVFQTEPNLIEQSERKRIHLEFGSEW